ncbi:myoneurin-like [Lineus longissimus]|uniref:myoneurin-like n=1 Tax=Lineus longissimus TaxID=88925 RepID=UPI002B4D2444
MAEANSENPPKVITDLAQLSPNWRLLWCNDCQEGHDGECERHGPMGIIQDHNPQKAYLTLPPMLIIKKMKDDDGESCKGVFANKTIPKGIRFGPIQGHSLTQGQALSMESQWLLFQEDGPLLAIETTDSSQCNWMMFVRKSLDPAKQNLVAFQYQDSIYYVTTKTILKNDELFFYYSENYYQLLTIVGLGPLFTGTNPPPKSLAEKVPKRQPKSPDQDDIHDSGGEKSASEAEEIETEEPMPCTRRSLRRGGKRRRVQQSRAKKSIKAETESAEPEPTDSTLVPKEDILQTALKMTTGDLSPVDINSDNALELEDNLEEEEEEYKSKGKRKVGLRKKHGKSVAKSKRKPRWQKIDLPPMEVNTTEEEPKPETPGTLALVNTGTHQNLVLIRPFLLDDDAGQPTAASASHDVNNYINSAVTQAISGTHLENKDQVLVTEANAVQANQGPFTTLLNNPNPQQIDLNMSLTDMIYQNQVAANQVTTSIEIAQQQTAEVSTPTSQTSITRIGTVQKFNEISALAASMVETSVKEEEEEEDVDEEEDGKDSDDSDDTITGEGTSNNGSTIVTQAAESAGLTVSQPQLPAGIDPKTLADKRMWKTCFVCATCGKIFTMPSRLKRHLKIHNPAGEFLCDICGKGFKQKSGLWRHEKIHNQERKFEHFCTLCGKGFFEKYHCRRHEERHTGQHFRFQCRICNKFFSASHHLKRHLLIHQGIRPFPCPTCGKRFTQKGDMQKHNMLHNKT